MLCTKAENPFANSTPAEGKATAVGHLCTRKNLPTAAPLPELLNNKTQKSCTLIYAVQSTAGLEKSCQHTSSFWAGSPRGLWWSPCPCTLLCYQLWEVTLGRDLEHSISNITKCSCRCQGHIICIMMTTQCGAKFSGSKCSLYVGGGLLASEGSNKMTHAEWAGDPGWCWEDQTAWNKLWSTGFQHRKFYSWHVSVNSHQSRSFFNGGSSWSRSKVRYSLQLLSLYDHRYPQFKGNVY